MLLEFENAVFDRAAADQLMNEDWLGLSDPVSAVSGLIFGRWVPPWIVVDDGVSRGEVEAGAASFQ